MKLMKCAVVALALSISANAFAESLLAKLLRIAGLTSAPGQMRGEEVDSGSIWIANLELETVKRLTTDGGYRSPVFSPADDGILALEDDTVVRIPFDGGPPARIQKVSGAKTIVGFDGQNPGEIVVLLEGGSSPLAVLFLASGKVNLLPYDSKSDDQQRMLARIRGQDRVYGDTSVYLNTEKRQGAVARQRVDRRLSTAGQ